ncbi:hypothetical protein [Candidatus Burkholderia verschuerenii]|uniref:hypothetical protein n=1 Tax=Candidatus Burkholderia verschuerenii TaxID=242163 RepID=UPI0012EE1B8F|nr:hypothetical protein [Candidatus Burkholderia verschuerenii]
MKAFFANREFLVLVAVVASAVSLYVRQEVVPLPAASAVVPSHAQFGRMCAPSSSSSSSSVSSDSARPLPADCELHRSVPEGLAIKSWV